METIKEYGDPVDFIREKLPHEEMFAQLAEECAELGKAALKMRRVLDGTNPTPVKEKEAYNNLVEEIADISLCLEVLGLNAPAVRVDVQGIMSRKLKRWCLRLEEAECSVCGETVNTNSKECPNCRVSRFDPDDLMGEYEEENG